ncbi:MAG: ABC transporter ATP-binding protein [Acidobacteria bacterium]|nr:ABC transporter ATP-binding protein [Acidobacteriota bacterium]
MTVGEAAVSLHGVTKKFGEHITAVDDVDLEIRDGEFFSLLGPSGCGKTTTLRMIAGLDYPTEGSIRIYGEEMGIRPPNKRPVNTVFQSYALFPHMNVEDNVGFGLRMQRVEKAEVKRKVEEAIDLVRMDGMGKRKPKELSGGQQQRVALARALVNRPRVLLLDEPLGALDLKLRQTMQLELKDIQHDVGITFIYVTHDQEEALTMSDRIGVMNEGKLVQVGTSEEIYQSPSNLFVASFVGEMSFLPGQIVEPGAVRLSGGEVVQAMTDSAAPGTSVTLSLRPEMVQLYANREECPTGRNAIDGSVVRKIFQGETMFYEVEIGESGSLEVHVENLPGMRRWEVGDVVVVDFHPEAAKALTG